MKLTFISDTHSLHRHLKLGSGDVLIHCGDFTGRGSLADTEDFADYIEKQDFTHKIVIAGNHERCFEDHRRHEGEAILKDAGIIYLNDSGIEISGFKFWGSPIQPTFFDWAFNRRRGKAIRQHWDLIPDDIDVLLTHGPAFGILDWCTHGERVGCKDLLETVQRIKPTIHAFGHIHESYGMCEIDNTIFVNACNLDERYTFKNPPIELTI